MATINTLQLNIVRNKIKRNRKKYQNKMRKCQVTFFCSEILLKSLKKVWSNDELFLFWITWNVNYKNQKLRLNQFWKLVLILMDHFKENLQKKKIISYMWHLKVKLKMIDQSQSCISNWIWTISVKNLKKTYSRKNEKGPNYVSIQSTIESFLRIK